MARKNWALHLMPKQQQLELAKDGRTIEKAMNVIFATCMVLLYLG
jgi:hypothetical protein